MLKRTLTFVAVLVGALAIVSVWSGLRATSLPGWIDEEALRARDAEDPPPGGLAGALGNLLGLDLGSAGKALWLVQELVNQGHVELDAVALSDITTTALSGNRNGRALLDAAAGLQSRVGEQRVEIGAVVDLGKVELDQLDNETRLIAERLLRWAPFLSGRELYFGLETTPRDAEGDLSLGEGAVLHIGRVRVPSWLSRALGIDARLREKLTVDLQVIELTDVRVIEDRVVLEATVASLIR